VTDDAPAELDLRSAPDDATIAEGLARAYRPYGVTVLALFATVVPALTALRAWLDGTWLWRVALAVVTLGVAVWATRRAMRDLVKAGVKARTGREATLTVTGERAVANGVPVPRTTLRVQATGRAVVVRGRGVPALILRRADVPEEALVRLRAH